MFCSPNSPILSNEDGIQLVQHYKVLMPMHHSSIVTMITTNIKSKDKRNGHLLSQYD